jgi:hypothetical protein
MSPAAENRSSLLAERGWQVGKLFGEEEQGFDSEEIKTEKIMKDGWE